MSVKFRHKNPGALKKVFKRYKNNFEIAVGFPSSKTKSIEYPTGESVIEVAAANNFGVPSRKIPRRPFMELSKKPATDKVKPLLKPLFQQLNKGQTTMERVMEKVAPVATAEFKKTIVRLKTPPNKPRTIKEKKSSNPLIDTGLMLESLTFEIRKERK